MSFWNRKKEKEESLARTQADINFMKNKEYEIEFWKKKYLELKKENDSNQLRDECRRLESLIGEYNVYALELEKENRKLQVKANLYDKMMDEQMNED